MEAPPEFGAPSSDFRTRAAAIRFARELRADGEALIVVDGRLGG